MIHITMITTDENDGDHDVEEDDEVHLPAAVHIQLLKSRAVSANLKHYYGYDHD